MADLWVCGLVLAAGSSRRLGRPKQLLPFRGYTLLDATLDRVRHFDLDQRVVAIGGAGPEVRRTVDLAGFTVVDNVAHTAGCSSSIVAALDRVDDRADGLLLFLGDQPDVPCAAVSSALATAERANMVVCHYRDGPGHPFWFGRDLLPELARLQGDKAIWKLLESGEWPVAEAPVDSDVPPDVDTWDDYRALLASEHVPARSPRK